MGTSLVKHIWVLKHPLLNNQMTLLVTQTLHNIIFVFGCSLSRKETQEQYARTKVMRNVREIR